MQKNKTKHTQMNHIQSLSSDKTIPKIFFIKYRSLEVREYKVKILDVVWSLKYCLAGRNFWLENVNMIYISYIIKDDSKHSLFFPTKLPIPPNVKKSYFQAKRHPKAFPTPSCHTEILPQCGSGAVGGLPTCWLHPPPGAG